MITMMILVVVMMMMVIIIVVVVCDNESLYTNKYTCLMTKEMGMWNLLPDHYIQKV